MTSTVIVKAHPSHNLECVARVKRVTHNVGDEGEDRWRHVDEVIPTGEERTYHVYGGGGDVQIEVFERPKAPATS